MRPPELLAEGAFASWPPTLKISGLSKERASLRVPAWDVTVTATEAEEETPAVTWHTTEESENHLDAMQEELSIRTPTVVSNDPKSDPDSVTNDDPSVMTLLIKIPLTGGTS